MYYYIIDKPKYKSRYFDRLIKRISGRLMNLNVDGEFAQSSPIRTVKRLAQLGLEKRHQTIIVIGQDESFNQVLQVIAGSEVALGFIPLVRSSRISQILGTGDILEACNVVASRKTEEVDLGRISGRYFFSFLNLGFSAKISRYVKDGRLGNLKTQINIFFDLLRYKAPRVEFECDGNFRIRCKLFMARVVNSINAKELKDIPFLSSQAFSPQDGFLNLIIAPKLSSFSRLKNAKTILKGSFKSLSEISLFKAKKIAVIAPKTEFVFADGVKIGKTPLQIDVAPKKLRVITGKERTF